MVNEPYRGKNAKRTRDFKVKEELDQTRRQFKEIINILWLILWVSVAAGAIAFGIFVRLLLFSGKI